MMLSLLFFALFFTVGSFSRSVQSAESKLSFLPFPFFPPRRFSVIPRPGYFLCVLLDKASFDVWCLFLLGAAVS